MYNDLTKNIQLYLSLEQLLILLKFHHHHAFKSVEVQTTSL